MCDTETAKKAHIFSQPRAKARHLVIDELAHSLEARSDDNLRPTRDLAHHICGRLREADYEFEHAKLECRALVVVVRVCLVLIDSVDLFSWSDTDGGNTNVPCRPPRVGNGRLTVGDGPQSTGGRIG